jgi:hypothetical protein
MNNIPNQLREFVDSVEPVTLNEMRRPLAPELAHQLRVAERRGSRRRHRWPAATAAVVVAVLLSLTLTIVHVSSSTSGSHFAVGHVLAADSIRLVADTSASALHSGTAQMDVTESHDGSVAFHYASKVTFSGSDLDESILFTQYPSAEGPPGGPTTSSTDVRLVDGAKYGLMGNGQWYVMTGPAAAKSLSFPDPRTFLSHISPAAGLVSLGPQKFRGTALTHLRARNPSVLGTFEVAALHDAKNTAFDMWIDDHNVVQRMTLAAAAETGGCWSETSPRTMPMHCEHHTETETVSITFANIGRPQTVSAPSGALPGSFLGPVQWNPGPTG